MAGVWIRRAPIKEPVDINQMKAQAVADVMMGNSEPATTTHEAKSDCPVCMDSFADSDDNAWYTTSCGHRTCKSCIEKCIQNSAACPICRHLLLNEKALSGFPKDRPLGLFILNPSFFAVPGSTVLLRVFEPRYLMLIKRCIASGQCFGLQAGFKARRGVLISIKRHRELPEGHIVMEGLAVARYEAFDDTCNPEEEPDTFGLYQMRSKIVVDNEHKLSTEIDAYRAMSKRAEELLQLKIADYPRYDKEVINKICGVCPSPSSYEFSFWLLGALFSPIPKADTLFCKDAIERMKFCLKLLEEDQPFECLMEEH